MAWGFTVPLEIDQYRDPVFEIDTPADPTTLTMLLGPKSSGDPILKVMMTREGPVALPVRRYDRMVNGVSITFGELADTLAMYWQDDLGHAYLATLSGGNRTSLERDAYAEQLAEEIVVH